MIKKFIKYFNNSPEYFKIKIILMGGLFVYTMGYYIVYPPFFKTQNIKIIQVEKNVRQSGYKTERSYNIHYKYVDMDGELIYGKFLSYYMNPKVGEYIDYSVRTRPQTGGELNLSKSTASMYVLLFFLLYFILVFLFKRVTFYVIKEEIRESSASAIVFIVLVLILMFWRII
jgi:hypothetical protein